MENQLQFIRREDLVAQNQRSQPQDSAIYTRLNFDDSVRTSTTKENSGIPSFLRTSQSSNQPVAGTPQTTQTRHYGDQFTTPWDTMPSFNSNRDKDQDSGSDQVQQPVVHSNLEPIEESKLSKAHSSTQNTELKPIEPVSLSEILNKADTPEPDDPKTGSKSPPAVQISRQKSNYLSQRESEKNRKASFSQSSNHDDSDGEEPEDTGRFDIPNQNCCKIIYGQQHDQYKVNHRGSATTTKSVPMFTNCTLWDIWIMPESSYRGKAQTHLRGLLISGANNCLEVTVLQEDGKQQEMFEVQIFMISQGSEYIIENTSKRKARVQLKSKPILL